MDGDTDAMKIFAVFLSCLLAQGPIITGHRSSKAHGTAGPNLGNVITNGYTNSGNILLCGGGFATVSIAPSSTGGHFVVSNFKFSIPNGATIAGITASIQHWDQTGNGGLKDSVVQLMKGGVATGSNLASATGWAAGSPETFTYGGTGNLWGTAWTSSDINASNFGLTFTANNTDAVDPAATIGISCVQLTVTY